MRCGSRGRGRGRRTPGLEASESWACAECVRFPAEMPRAAAAVRLGSRVCSGPLRRSRPCASSAPRLHAAGSAPRPRAGGRRRRLRGRRRLGPRRAPAEDRDAVPLHRGRRAALGALHRLARPLGGDRRDGRGDDAGCASSPASTCCRCGTRSSSRRRSATAAVLSGGRVTLGVGAGWMREEFELLEQPFEGRGRRMDEMIELLRALWAGGWVEHHGEFYDFAPLEMSPAARRAGADLGGRPLGARAAPGGPARRRLDLGPPHDGRAARDRRARCAPAPRRLGARRPALRGVRRR